MIIQEARQKSANLKLVYLEEWPTSGVKQFTPNFLPIVPCPTYVENVKKMSQVFPVCR